MPEHPLTRLARERARLEQVLQVQKQRRGATSAGRPRRVRRRLTALLQRA